jgi:uncharacterized membrane protein YeiH
MGIIDFIAYGGTFVFGLAGAFKARKYEMDIFGGCVLAFVSAYGGGTVRDLLIGVRPVNWINDNVVLSLVFAATFVAFLVRKNVNHYTKIIFYTDALGLGFYTALGIEKSLAYGLNDLYALIMGVITATFGGLVADIICSEKPDLLKRGELYATASAIGGVVYIKAKSFVTDNTFILIFCVLLVAALRIYSKRKSFGLPKI